MERREFAKMMGSIVAGLVAGSRVFAAETKKASPKAPAKAAKHDCKGKNDCSPAAERTAARERDPASASGAAHAGATTGGRALRNSRVFQIS